MIHKLLPNCFCLLVYWECFRELFFLPKNTDPVLETSPYQRFPRDNSLSKLCALNHRQKELHPNRGRSTGYRCRSNHIEPRSLNCIANKVLFSIWVSSLKEWFPKILLQRENRSYFYLLQTMNWIRHADISVVQITTSFIYIFCTMNPRS